MVAQPAGTGGETTTTSCECRRLQRSEEEVKSLDDIQNDFYAEVGHKPHTVKQLLAYCKQKETGHKFKDINQWWPNRPEPEEKPQQKAVNADDYKDPNEAAAADNGDDND